MKLFFMSDLHGTIPTKQLSRIRELSKSDDFFLVTGDIVNHYSNLSRTVEQLRNYTRARFGFVLGNHDFWGSGLSEAHYDLDTNENYIPNRMSVQLTSDTVMVGVDGWYSADGSENVSASHINDVFNIQEFAGKSNETRLRMMRNQSKLESSKLDNKLSYVRDDYKNVIIATHVPPFNEVLVRRPNELDASIFMMSSHMNDVIRSHADKNKSVNYTVLCGHTHRYADMYLANNIRCVVASFCEHYIFDIPA